MNGPINFDPTKKAPSQQQARSMGQIVIQYDPNSGRLGYQSQGLLPIEELGVTQWFLLTRFKEMDKLADQKAVIIAPPPGAGMQ